MRRLTPQSAPSNASTSARGRAFVDDPALPQGNHPVGPFGDHRQVMGCQDDPFPFLRNLSQETEESPLGKNVHAVQRFIEYQEALVRSQSE